MIDIDVSLDTMELERSLSSLFKKQIPYAASEAINKTLFDLREAEQKEIKRVFNKPKAFTVNGVYVTKSNKKNLEGDLHIKSKRYEYLKYHIDGGQRLPKRKAIPVPTMLMKRGRTGKVARGAINRLLADPKVFNGEINGVAGLWRTYVRRQPKLLVAWEPVVNYRKRFNYYETARRFIAVNYRRNLIRSIEYAISTAR